MLTVNNIDYSAAHCLTIAEVAQAHDGSLGLAHSYIDAIADAGADAVKFQTHIAAAESTRAEPWRVTFSRQDASRYDYWQRMAFTPDQWAGLKSHADDRGLLFISSPFSIEAVELLTNINVALWKVASGEVNNPILLDKIIRTGLPVLLSSGMSTLDELDKAVEQVKAARCQLAVLQCTSSYPCPPEKVGMNMLGVFRDRFGCDVGLSDHSGTVFPGLAAATLGATVIEVHVTFDRRMFGPDVCASVTIDELAELANGVRFINSMMSCPVDKDVAAGACSDMRSLFNKSVVPSRAIPEGTIITAGDLSLKKPGAGIPVSRFDDVVGCRAKRSFAADELISFEDLAQ